MFRRGFRRFFRGISARSPLAFPFASPPRLPDGGRLCALFPWPAFVPLFAAHHLDAAKVTELLLWILAFTTYVILGLVILVRIGRSIREGKNSSPDYGSESEMFRDLCRRKLISPEEYKKIQTRLRDRLVSDVLNRNPASSGSANEGNAAPDPELEKALRLQALLRGEKTRR